MTSIIEMQSFAQVSNATLLPALALPLLDLDLLPKLRLALLKSGRGRLLHFRRRWGSGGGYLCRSLSLTLMCRRPILTPRVGDVVHQAGEVRLEPMREPSWSQFSITEVPAWASAMSARMLAWSKAEKAALDPESVAHGQQVSTLLSRPRKTSPTLIDISIEGIQGLRKLPELKLFPPDFW